MPEAFFQAQHYPSVCPDFSVYLCIFPFCVHHCYSCENFLPGDSHAVSGWQESGLGLAIHFSLSSEETKAHTSVCTLAPLSAVPGHRDEKEPVSVGTSGNPSELAICPL